MLAGLSANQARGLRKNLGLVAARAKFSIFWAEGLIEDRPELAVRPPLEARKAIEQHIHDLDCKVLKVLRPWDQGRARPGYDSVTLALLRCRECARCRVCVAQRSTSGRVACVAILGPAKAQVACQGLRSAAADTQTLPANV